MKLWSKFGLAWVLICLYAMLSRILWLLEIANACDVTLDVTGYWKVTAVFFLVLSLFVLAD